MKTRDSIKTYSQIEQLAEDLASKQLSESGKSAIAVALVDSIRVHGKWIDETLATIESHEKKIREFEEKIAKPKQLEDEFKTVAKKLNFPLVQEFDGGAVDYNKVTSYEDKVPQRTLKFIKDCLNDKDLSKVDVPKSERLSKKEIAAYKEIATSIEHGSIDSSTSTREVEVEESAKKSTRSRKVKKHASKSRRVK